MSKQCPRCAVGDFGRAPRADGVKHKATCKAPGLARLERFVSDGVACATDGCRVEVDGTCQHGHSSWVRALGYV